MGPLALFFSNLCEPFSQKAWVLILRLIIAAIAGGAVGFERGLHGRAAGFRTHMLVSMGAALTAIIGFSVSIGMKELGINSDAARISAQVISGIGFLGVGTILLKKGSSQITGLTTAAGLWATAALGLAIGYGYLAVGITAAVIFILTFTLLSRLEFRLRYKRQRVFIYVELKSVESVREIADHLRSTYSAIEVSVTPSRSGTAANVGMEALVSVPAGKSAIELAHTIEEKENVVFVLPL